jgi:hypothetical protein
MLRRRNKTPHRLDIKHTTGCKHPRLRSFTILFGCNKKDFSVRKINKLTLADGTEL